jgi:hypothetical protein
MYRFVVLLLLLATLGGCATTTLTSVRAPMGECTNRCFTAYVGAEARATCLRTCPGARPVAAGCAGPPVATMPCVELVVHSGESDIAGDIAGEILGGIFRELVLAILTAPFH